MRRVVIGVSGFLTLACATWSAELGSVELGDRGQKSPKAEVPKADQPKVASGNRALVDLGDEGGLSPQQLTDRCIEVRASLDKPGVVPEYELGEPIVVNLDIRNMSKHHLFKIPLWGSRLKLEPTKYGMAYVVQARRFGEAVPLTTLGWRSVECLSRSLPVASRSTTPRFDADPLHHPRFLGENTNQPTPAHMIVNTLCDMSEPGDYELAVKFRVDVMNPGEGPVVKGKTVKVVDPTPPIRLRVSGRLHHLEPPPVYPARRPD